MSDNSIYPDGGRENVLYTTYCDIAMRAYYNAYLLHEKIKKENYSGELSEEKSLLEEQVVVTVVFSAMCIEAFFNDYAAACLGDSEFYDNFDRLSALSKFKLISKFILKTDIDKSKAYYSYLRSLFSLRDSYVHSKSKEISFKGFTEEELEARERFLDEHGIKFEIPLLDKEYICSNMRQALNALKTIKEIAKFFDFYDDNVFASAKLFSPSVAFFIKGEEYKYKQYVLTLLGIKAEDYAR